jgi:hypothetical protein
MRPTAENNYEVLQKAHGLQPVGVSVHRSELTGTEEVFGTRYSIMAIIFAKNLLRPLPAP